MINFNDDDSQIRKTLTQNQDYVSFVSKNNHLGYIFIDVENGHIVLFHNINDTFDAYILPSELYYFRDNIDDIRRIANAIQKFATDDYRKNNP